MKIANLWSGQRASGLFRIVLLLGILSVSLNMFLFHGETVQASTPLSSGTITTTGPVTPFTGTWAGDRAVGASPNGEASCSTGDASAANCDVFTLTVAPGNWVGKRVVVRFNWTLPANDYDMTIRRESNGTVGMQGDGVGVTQPPPLDEVVTTSGNGTGTFEEAVLSPPNAGAVYYIRAIYFLAPNLTDQYQGSVTIESTSTTPPPSACVVPSFDNYQPPVGYPKRDNSGEPSIGVNWNTGNITTMSRLQPNRTTFNDSVSPADPNVTTWFARSLPLVATGLDPIGFTDPITGRSFYGELNGNFTNGVISDDDLTTALSLPTLGFSPTSSVDHQTIGGGPPNPNIVGRQPTTSYPHLVYYAAQNVAVATVSTSLNGGLTFAVDSVSGTPAYTLAQCGGLHGHIKVAPDGTVYLPNKNCSGKTGTAVSVDNGLTWTVRTIPTSTSGSTDPSIGIGAGGRVYEAYSGGDNHPHVAVSDDRGATWHDDFDLAALVTPTPLTAAVFMQSVAGDNNRATVFFLGTSSTNPGNPVGDDTGTIFKGTWYPYMATTCDGGKSWSVVRADNDPLPGRNGLPNPVQQGVICTSGTTCPDDGTHDTRNLLDFNEIAVDARGRAVAVYADGCNFDHPCIGITDNSGDKSTNQSIARLTIIRQRGGTRLFQEFDAAIAPPLSPFVDVKESAKGNNIFWGTPDDNGSPLRKYRIYRGEKGRSEKLVAEVKAGSNSFVDRKRKRGRDYYYHVTAVNAYGESSRVAKTFVSKGS